jgi:hypothetical protein
MKKLAALLILANVLLLGQAPSPGKAAPARTPLADQAKQSSKKVRPELTVPNTPAATLFQSTCVYPTLDKKSVSIQPCRKDSRKLFLAPPSPTTPASPPGNNR